MKTIYALLVGIDEYPSPIPGLRGCVNDIHAMKQYLEARVDPGSKNLADTLKIKVLLNHEATREAVIADFRSHLGQANADDVILFCYSGHGSQEQAPEEFWHLEPDHRNETLVLYNSRKEGSWDLADKELAKLISEVSINNPHVVVILDCCHSGSGTRAPGLAETAVRRIEADRRKRPLSSFIVKLDELPHIGLSRTLVNQTSGWDIAGRHILLAACRDDEEAKEYVGDGIDRGAFSYFLLETLRTASEQTNYRDLFAHASARVRDHGQSPQLEATVPHDITQPFLGGAIRPLPRYFMVSQQAGRWLIDGGLIHGLPSSTPDDAVEFALFAFNATDEDIQNPNNAIGRATLTKPLFSSSSIQIIDGAVSPDASPFKAVLIHAPIPRLRISVEGDIQGTELVRQVMAYSLFIRESAQSERADYRLLAQSEQYLIVRSGDTLPLVEPISGYTDTSARRMIEWLEHIERWKTTAELENPYTTIRLDELDIEILKNGQPLTGSEIQLAYSLDDSGNWIHPEITIRFRNTGRRVLYIGLLDLPETFGIFPMLRHIGCQRLEPGQETSANDGEPISVTIPDELWERGVSELRDIVKVIVSTSEFDVRRLEQPDLDGPMNHTLLPAYNGTSRGLQAKGTLEILMDRVQTRHAGQAKPRWIDDWRTHQFSFRTSRPLPAT